MQPGSVLGQAVTTLERQAGVTSMNHVKTDHRIGLTAPKGKTDGQEDKENDSRVIPNTAEKRVAGTMSLQKMWSWEAKATRSSNARKPSLLPSTGGRMRG